MISVGVRELREQVSKLLQRVREQGEVVEITYHGETVARLVPVKPALVAPATLAGVWTDVDQLAAEIGNHWPETLTAVDAVREERREL